MHHLQSSRIELIFERIWNIVVKQVKSQYQFLTYRVFQKKQYRNAIIRTNVAKVYWFCMCVHVIKIITL